MAALGLFFVILGAGQWVNGVEWGKYSLFFGLVFWLGVLYQWFGEAIAESEGGQYGHKIDLSFRWSMSWFIFSEVMFFGAFFSALWWARAHSVPMLGSLDNALLWPDFKAVWPTAAAGMTASPAGIIEPFQTMTPFWLPTINTALLLTSGVTLTIAHHALIENKRDTTIKFMWLTVLLGVVFLFVQRLRIRPRLQRHEPQAQLGCVWFYVLHAHRLPRIPCVFGHVDAARHYPALAKRPFHG
jgi:cytochrome c oxidase subunit 3